MKGSTFATLPISEKKKIMQAATRGANKDQRELSKRYKSLLKKNGYSRN